MTVPDGRRGSAGTASAATQEAVDAHRDDGSAELFGITELCQQFGITPRTIRFYEDKGLLAPRRVNGTRVYTRRDHARLALILRSKAIGASLEEIKHFLDLYGAHGEGRVQQMRYVVQRTDEAIRQLETKQAHIEASLSELRLINQRVRGALAAQGPRS
ncbi:MAG: MerR family DNA-binding transcriptional regulator [Ideonella sp. WA131b]|jgi:DNA-binding transcriptional MerR regulator|nr:MerR family DNA-binding transcriptional regulator [Ideonella sp. WA131b]